MYPVIVHWILVYLCQQTCEATVRPKIAFTINQYLVMLWNQADYTYWYIRYILKWIQQHPSSLFTFWLSKTIFDFSIINNLIHFVLDCSGVCCLVSNYQACGSRTQTTGGLHPQPWSPSTIFELGYENDLPNTLSTSLNPKEKIQAVRKWIGYL